MRTVRVFRTIVMRNVWRGMEIYRAQTTRKLSREVPPAILRVKNALFASGGRRRKPGGHPSGLDSIVTP